jgi:hypothetical protein
MAKSKRKGLPKTSGEWKALSTEEVMHKVFGKRGHKHLKQKAKESARKSKKD